MTEEGKLKYRSFGLGKRQRCRTQTVQKQRLPGRSDAQLSEDELVQALPKFSGICVRSKTSLSRRVLDAATVGELLVIRAFCIGTEHIDCEYAASKGMVVFNAPFPIRAAWPRWSCVK